MGRFSRRCRSFTQSLLHQIHRQGNHLVFSYFWGQCWPHRSHVFRSSFLCPHFCHPSILF
nr:MAG TPA: hypothetical protein [Caudoviricetes sp.]